jgi:IS1 family transposase
VKGKGVVANHLSFEKKRLAIHMLVEGNSIRTTERIVGVHRDTIIRLMVRVGERCTELLDGAVQGISADSVECDEIWAFVAKKQRRCSPLESALGAVGDQYTYVAMDSDTKLVISHTVGKRDGATTRSFIHDLCARLDGRTQISTDGFDQYVGAIEAEFGADVDYAQVIKEYVAEHPGRGRYSPPKVGSTKKVIVTGDPNDSDIGTSYVERQNLTMRMSMRRFTRLTNAFSKKLRNLKAAVALHFCYYNFCRPHASLKGCTPAMQAGLTDHVWGLNELLAGERPATRKAA